MSTLRMARRRSLMPALLSVVLLGVVPLVSACGAGKNAPVRRESSVADGVEASVGNMVLRNLYLTADVDGHQSSKELALEGVVANGTGANDTLLLVSTGTTPFTATPSATASASASPSGSAAPSAGAPTSLPATVAPGTLVYLGTKGLGLRVTNLPSAVLPGDLVTVRFSFRNAGAVSVSVPVYSLASRVALPTNTQVPPKPEVGNQYNEPETDNESAQPSS